MARQMAPTINNYRSVSDFFFAFLAAPQATFLFLARKSNFDGVLGLLRVYCASFFEGCFE